MVCIQYMEGKKHSLDTLYTLKTLDFNIYIYYIYDMISIPKRTHLDIHMTHRYHSTHKTRHVTVSHRICRILSRSSHLALSLLFLGLFLNHPAAQVQHALIASNYKSSHTFDYAFPEKTSFLDKKHAFAVPRYILKRTRAVPTPLRIDTVKTKKTGIREETPHLKGVRENENISRRKYHPHGQLPPIPTKFLPQHNGFYTQFGKTQPPLRIKVVMFSWPTPTTHPI